MEIKRIGPKTIEMNGVKAFQGKGSTIYIRIDGHPYSISKDHDPKMHKALDQLLRGDQQ